MCRYGVLAFAILIFAGSASAQTPCENSSGNGSDIPYATTNINQLQAITSSPTSNYVLCENIDATGMDFVPIGGADGFSGTFDGNNMTISNLTINRPSSSRVGLFGKLSSSGEIRNLNLVNVNVTGRDLVGALVGESLGNIERSTVTGTVAGRHQVGGLVGAFSNANLSDCRSDVLVRTKAKNAPQRTKEYLGGLVGELSGATVNRCSAMGDLALPNGKSPARIQLAERIVGGLIGLATGSRVLNSIATGQINAGAATAGGLIGRAINTMISESLASGAVAALRNAGGLVGILGRDNPTFRRSTVLNSYSTGNIDDSGILPQIRTGGLIGEVQEIWLVRNSYARGNPEPDAVVDFGSLLGYVFGTGVVENSFATGSSQRPFIDYVDSSAKLTLNGNYYTGTMAPSGVTTQVALAQLQCPTAPGDVCDGITPFENWDPYLWNFGTDKELPTLKTDLPPGCSQVDISYSVGEDGSINNPYKIDTICRLQGIQGNLTAHYKLVENLDATEAGLWNNGSGFIPIGDNDAGFSGTFDGNSMSISNLTISRASPRVGLFRKLGSDGEIRDLNLVDLNVTGDTIVGGMVGESRGVIDGGTLNGSVAGRYQVGGLVGLLSSGGEIRNISLENVQVTEARAFNGRGMVIGGLAGESQGIIESSTITGSVTGINKVGGLVGEGGGSIREVSVTGSVTGINKVGGLAGEFVNGNLSDCESSATVQPRLSAPREGEYLGGLVGRLSAATVSLCSATGNVILSNTRNQRQLVLSERIAGGLIGLAENSIVQKSSATGQVNAGAATAGGLIGLAIESMVSESYASGTVRATQKAGGLIGLLGMRRVSNPDPFPDRISRVLNSYSTGNVDGSGSVDVVGAGGLIGQLEEAWMVRNSYATGSVKPQGVRFGSLLGYAFGTGVVENSFATGSPESGFIYEVNSTATLTLNENYYTGTMAPSGVTTQVALAQLQCPTTPGDVCDGITPFENWDPKIWDFGSDAELPELIPIPTVQITVKLPVGVKNLLGFTLDTTPSDIPLEVRVMLSPAPVSNSVLRVALTKTSGTVSVCDSNSDTGCVFLRINGKRTDTVLVSAGTSEADLMLSLDIAGEITLGQTGEFGLDLRLSNHPNMVSGNVRISFQQGTATRRPGPESASLRLRAFLGGAVR